MTDIVERLRHTAYEEAAAVSERLRRWHTAYEEAADEIEKLRDDLEAAKAVIMDRNEEIERLRALADARQDHLIEGGRLIEELIGKLATEKNPK